MRSEKGSCDLVNGGISRSRSIYDFLVEHSQPAARNIVEKILSRVRQIESFPESGPIQQTLKNRNKAYRYLVEGNYKIIYSPADQFAYIETVFDTRYDPDKLKV